MMDKGDDVPVALHENMDASIDESLALIADWHGKAQGRIRYCFAPRFALSCTSELLSRVGKLAKEHDVIVHTHASENRNECKLVESETGLRNVNYLDSLGLSGRHVVLAHCVHLDAAEFHGSRDEGPGVARRNHGVGLVLPDEFDGADHRGIFLFPDRLERFVLHRQHLAGVDDVNALIAELSVRRSAADFVLVTHQKQSRDL